MWLRALSAQLPIALITLIRWEKHYPFGFSKLLKATIETAIKTLKCYFGRIIMISEKGSPA